jgi:hypothetical protein
MREDLILRYKKQVVQRAKENFPLKYEVSFKDGLNGVSVAVGTVSKVEKDYFEMELGVGYFVCVAYADMETFTPLN